MVKSYLLLFLLILLLLPNSLYSQNSFLEKLLRKNPLLDTILQKKNEYDIQIIYTQVNRDKNNIPSFHSYRFNVDDSRYFYPASTVKLPAALLSLEKLNQLNIPFVTKESRISIDSTVAGQSPVKFDFTSQDKYPSISNYIKKIFLISDNDAYNRLYDFLTPEEFNRKLQEKGYKSARILHKLALVLSREQNRFANAVNFYNNDTIVYRQKVSFWDKDIASKKPILKGRGNLLRDSLVMKPKNFAASNFISLTDLQKMLRSVFFPEQATAGSRFDLTEKDYRFLYQYMSEYPQESAFPKYDTVEFYPAFAKFLLFGSSKARLPENIRIFNKIGQAYGFVTDNAYIVDFENSVEFFLSAVILVNRDGIFNDGVYEYETEAFPFMRELGKEIYQYELKRQRKYRPDLRKFKMDYN
jgi:hypothetical protein